MTALRITIFSLDLIYFLLFPFSIMIQPVPECVPLASMCVDDSEMKERNFVSLFIFIIQAHLEVLQRNAYEWIQKIRRLK